MTDHIGEATKKVIDLDALEKLADEVLESQKGADLQRMADADQAFYMLSDPTTIKALIAELKEARGLLANIHERATEGHKQAGCDNWRAVERCRQIANLTERAFLARNGEVL